MLQTVMSIPSWYRPDLKQVMQELMVSQDGGVPFMSKSHDGNASDNNVFRERCAAILKEFAALEEPRYLVADSKLYTSENAVGEHRRDIAKPDQSTHFQTYSSLGFSDVRGYS